MKINHYARPVNTSISTFGEGTVLQLVFGVLSTGFAIGGYNAKVPQLMIPCGFVALLCFGLLAYSVYNYVEEKHYQRKQMEQAPSDSTEDSPT